MSKEGLRRIEIEVVRVGEAWAQKPVAATLRIRNRARFWSIRDLVVVGEVVEAPFVVSSLDGTSSVEVRAKLRFSRRGRVNLGHVDLYTRFPFGLFMKKRRIRLASEALVYPAILPDSGFGVDFATTTGDRRPSGVLGRGNDVLSFREYVRGDELRHVHWKKSATTGRWILKQREAESNPQVVVSFDSWLPPGTSDEHFERLVSQASTYVRHALDRGWDVRLHVGRQVIHASPADCARVFEALALVEPTIDATSIHRGPGVAIFTLRGAAGEARSA
jgi:uncharacterized protein (DUF58 family)